MPANSKEQNMAQIEHHNNMAWQEALDVLLASPFTLSLALKECESITECRVFNDAFPRAMMLLGLATVKLIEEAVRRGMMPKQKLDPPQNENPG